VVLKKRRRKWLWRVSTTDGDAVIEGSESSRPAANFLLLCLPEIKSGHIRDAIRRGPVGTLSTRIGFSVHTGPYLNGTYRFKASGRIKRLTAAATIAIPTSWMREAVCQLATCTRYPKI
jgi:hypothetical protein